MTAIYHLTVAALLIGAWMFLPKMAISQLWNINDSAYEAFGFLFFFACSSPPYPFSLSLFPWDREKLIFCIYLLAGVNVHICGELFLVAAPFTDTLFLLREVVKYLKVTPFSTKNVEPRYTTVLNVVSYTWFSFDFPDILWKGQKDHFIFSGWFPLLQSHCLFLLTVTFFKMEWQIVSLSKDS